MRTVLSALCVAAFAATIAAQPSAPPREGDIVTLIVPRAALGKPNYNLGIYQVRALVRSDGTATFPSASQGVPAVIEGRIKKISKNKNMQTVSIVSDPETVLLDFADVTPAALGTAFWSIVLHGPSSSPEAQARIQGFAENAATLPGLPAAIPSFQRRAIIDKAIALRAEGAGGESFKGRTYLAINLGDDALVYNNLRMGPQARVARAITERMLPIAKDSLPFASGNPGIDGIALHVNVLSRNALHQFEDPSAEALALYFPTDALQKFATTDITGQQLIEASTCLLAGAKIEPVLSAGG